jgi:hypothetical protein
LEWLTLYLDIKLSRIDKIELYYTPVLNTILSITPFDAKMVYLRERLIGHLLHEVKPIKKSGYISERALEKLESGEYFRYHKPGARGRVLCHEHFYSRQKSGKILCKIYDLHLLNRQLLVELLDCFSIVHLVLPEENIALARIQNNEHTYKLHWKDQYKLAGVDLVKDPKEKNFTKLNDADDIIKRHIDKDIAALLD